ncbi:required for excision 1-B domain-containing protein isoform X1 [Notamacropus eugenii]|uniref:required for excision 1-B domain-containing protein isoform X1 n=1 Tax=Notamacropus eugenii TaxID=9315 RepID=UPI003B6765E9
MLAYYYCHTWESEHVCGQKGQARVRDLLLQLQDLQAERSEAFGLLDQGHQAYLRSGPHYDFPRYRQLVHEVTEAFASISREVLAIQEQLRDTHVRPDLAQHLARLQEQEQQRLELTAALQLARQKAQEEPGAAAPREEVQELRQRHQLLDSTHSKGLLNVYCLFSLGGGDRSCPLHYPPSAWKGDGLGTNQLMRPPPPSNPLAENI